MGVTIGNAMRWPRPKSLNSLLLTGFAVISAPLLLAVVMSATKIRKLSDESADLVRSGVEATHYSQQLFQQITPLERATKVYSVLNDVDMLQGYRESRTRLQLTLNELDRVAKDKVRSEYIRRLLQ